MFFWLLEVGGRSRSRSKNRRRVSRTSRRSRSRKIRRTKSWMTCGRGDDGQKQPGSDSLFRNFNSGKLLIWSV